MPGTDNESRRTSLIIEKVRDLTYGGVKLRNVIKTRINEQVTIIWIVIFNSA